MTLKLPNMINCQQLWNLKNAPCRMSFMILEQLSVFYSTRKVHTYVKFEGSFFQFQHLWSHSGALLVVKSKDIYKPMKKSFANFFGEFQNDSLWNYLFSQCHYDEVSFIGSKYITFPVWCLMVCGRCFLAGNNSKKCFNSFLFIFF